MFGWVPLVRPHILCSAFVWVAEAFFPVTTLVFSLIVLSISGDLVSLTHAESDYGFCGLSLATGVLTLITVGPMCDRIFGVVGLFTQY